MSRIELSAGDTCTCPRDRAHLNEGAFHNVPVSLCPTCQGVLIRQRHMNSLLDAMSKELQRTIPLDCPLDRVPDRGPNVLCPVCSVRMENYGYMGSPLVMVDACHACRVLWMDAFELGAMSVQYARTTRRVDVIHMREETARLERARMAEALDVSNAVSRLMLTGFVLGGMV